MGSLLKFLQGIRARKAPANDFVGYEVLLNFIKERCLHKLDGDLIEIGSFMGGGTAKLARFARKNHKLVYAIDIFDPAADETATPDGIRMCDIYQAFLKGRSQLEVYRETVRGLDNVVTIIKDSKEASFPKEQRFIFGFIDGNHRPDYVRNDFSIIWPNLVPGGALGFHDYNTELPEVTRCIDGLMAEHAGEISETHEIRPEHIILLMKGHTADKA